MQLRDTDHAIETYAIMLNRPQWHDRIDTQREVWNRLAAAEDGDEVIVLADVDTALRGMMDARTVGARVDAILPFDVIATAAHLARERIHRVRTMVENIDRPDVYLAETISRLERFSLDGSDTKPHRRAVIEAIRADLTLAEVEDDVLVAIMSSVTSMLSRYDALMLADGR